MKLTRTKLSVAIVASLSSFAYADEANSTKLDVVQVVSENAGAKMKTDVVTLDQINKSTATDLKGLLKAEPSINFGGGNGTSQWLTIRGMGQDQVDFKVDNTSTDGQLFHHQGRFMLLDPSLIKRISIVKGSGSASAGIGATSGQIIAKTVDAKDLLKDDQNFGFKVNGGYSSNKGNTKGGTVFGKYGNVDALVSGSWTDEKEYKDGNGTKPKNSALGERGLLAKIGVDINENHRVVLSQRQERYYGTRNLREEFDFTLDPTNSRGNEGGYRITTTNTTNLEYTGKNVGFVDNIDANVYTMRTQREEIGVISRGQYRAYGASELRTKGANLNLTSFIGENHALKYGLNWRGQEGRPNALAANTFNQKKDDTGVYAEGIWGFGPVTLTTGARYDHFEFRASDGKKVSKGHVNPSVGLIYEVIDGLSLNAVHNYATRSPRLYEVALSGSPRSVADNLKAERARNTEVGFNYNLSDAFSLKGSYFWSTIKDAYGYETINSVSTLVNGGRIENHGYELDSAYRINGFTFRAGVAYSRPEIYGNLADKHQNALRIGRTWTTGASYQFENPSIELGWNGRFVEGEKGTPTRGSSDTGEAEVYRPGYAVHDFYVNWQPTAKKDLNINLALNNAFNKYYKSHSQRTGANSLPERGRDFRVNVNYTF
nr:TonB-dependent siderophore receptor [uncultured Haemophilus sp.]